MFSRETFEEPRIEISSLVDVVFLLLIFFMVTTRFAEQQVVEVQLPSAEGETREVESDVPVLSLDSSNRLFLDGELLEPADLHARLRARFADLSGPDRVLTVSGDAEADWGPMLEVFDACRRLGITQAIAQTDPGRRESSGRR